MRITAVRPVAVTVPYERDPMSYFFVRIETDDGLVGVGESCDSYGCTYASVLAAVVTDVFAPLLIGQEVTSVEATTDRLRLFTRRRLGDTWIAPQARSAVEIALWDLVGQAAGRSVSELLGQVRPRVEVYASSTFLEEGDADWHARQLEPLLQRGVSKAKLRVGPEWATDLQVLAKLRSLLDPATELMVDGSECFTLPTALEIARQLADLGVRWFEEPLPQFEGAGIEELVARSPVPIAYGEHLFGVDDTLDALRRSQLSVVQPDASTCGGIAAARAVAGVAVPFGSRVVLHACAGPISLAANLHVAATVPSIRLLEYPFGQAEGWKRLGSGFRLAIDDIEDGCLPVPTGPGLGGTLDGDAVRDLPYQLPGTRVAGSRAGLPDRFVGDR